MMEIRAAGERRIGCNRVDMKRRKENEMGEENEMACTYAGGPNRDRRTKGHEYEGAGNETGERANGYQEGRQPNIYMHMRARSK